MAYENYNIQEFEDAWFKEDTGVMSREEFKIVYDEYIDTAGLYDLEEFDKVTYIYFINNRINTLRISIISQRKYITEFGLPYLPNIDTINNFGYLLIWNEDINNFLEQLENIESAEIRFTDILEDAKLELDKIRSKKANDEPVTLKSQRESFKRTINSLRKIGWSIDKQRDTPEDLALIIKQQLDEN